MWPFLCNRWTMFEWWVCGSDELHNQYVWTRLFMSNRYLYIYSNRYVIHVFQVQQSSVLDPTAPQATLHKRPASNATVTLVTSPIRIARAQVGDRTQSTPVGKDTLGSLPIVRVPLDEFGICAVPMRHMAIGPRHNNYNDNTIGHSSSRNNKIDIAFCSAICCTRICHHLICRLCLRSGLPD